MNIQDIRQKYPQYKDLTDEQLSKALHGRYYSDIDFDEFSQKIGLIQSSVKAPEQVEAAQVDIESLSEIGVSPELNEISLKGFQRSMAASLMGDESELARALEKNTPGSEVFQDASGRFGIRMPSGQAYAINKPGLSPQDFIQFITRAAAFIPAGRGITGIGAATLGRAAGQAALTEEVLQLAEVGAGGEFDVGQAAIAAGAAPVGQLAGEAIGTVVKRALQPKGVQDAVIRSAPSIDQLKQAASNVYDEVDEIGVSIKPSVYRQFTDKVASTLRKEGLDPDLTKDASSLVRRLDSDVGASTKIGDIVTIRKLASDVARSQNPSDARLGAIALDEIDQFIDVIGPKTLEGSGKKSVSGMSVGKALKQARNNWGRAKRAELVEQAFNAAEFEPTGFENTLRQEFRKILRRVNKGKLKGFSKEEVQAMKTVAEGTPLGNMAKQLGKLGIPEDQATNSLMLTLAGGLGGGAGFALGGPSGAAVGVGAAIGLPTIFRKAANNITTNNAKLASAIIRSDGNARKIITAYLKNTPKDQQSSSGMAALLFNSGADVSTYKEIGDKLVDDAIFGVRNLITTEATQERGDYGL